MPNPKRERQRQARLARAEAEREQRRRRQRRRQITIAVVAGIALVAIVFATSSRGGDDENVTAGGAGDTTLCEEVAAPETPTTLTEPPKRCIDPKATYVATMKTDVGVVTLELDAAAAPTTVNNFVYLAQRHFYDGVPFHRVIPGFVVQGGDATNGDGSGGPGYTIEDELPEVPEPPDGTDASAPAAESAYPVGTVAMANTGAPNSGGSQFFIVTGQEGEKLPPKYTRFGKVTGGLDIVRKIEADGSPTGKPTTVHTIETITIATEET